MMSTEKSTGITGRLETNSLGKEAGIAVPTSGPEGSNGPRLNSGNARSAVGASYHGSSGISGSVPADATPAALTQRVEEMFAELAELTPTNFGELDLSLSPATISLNPAKPDQQVRDLRLILSAENHATPFIYSGSHLREVSGKDAATIGKSNSPERVDALVQAVETAIAKFKLLNDLKADMHRCGKFPVDVKLEGVELPPYENLRLYAINDLMHVQGDAPKTWMERVLSLKTVPEDLLTSLSWKKFDPDVSSLARYDLETLKNLAGSIRSAIADFQ